MDKRVKEKIIQELEHIGHIQKKDVVKLIKTYDDFPDTNRLIEKHYSEKANKLMATFKDEKNIRNCYAVKNPDNTTKYIDLSKPLLNDVKDVEAVKENFRGKNKANMFSIIKADICSKIIEGQITIENYEEELEKQISNL